MYRKRQPRKQLEISGAELSDTKTSFDTASEGI